MKIIGFNFTKISAEKTTNKPKEIKANTNIHISEIKEVNSDFLSSNEKVIGIKFINLIDYAPDFAKIELGGNILLSVDEFLFKKIIEDWKKKEIPSEIRLIIFNLILKKSTIRAFQLEEEMNIPPHIQLPSFTNEQKNTKDTN